MPVAWRIRAVMKSILSGALKRSPGDCAYIELAQDAASGFAGKTFMIGIVE
jgi:hypothetical protein